MNLLRSFFFFSFRLCSSLSEGFKASFAMNLWSIWKSRNELLWNGKDDGVEDIVFRAASYTKIGAVFTLALMD